MPAIAGSTLGVAELSTSRTSASSVLFSSETRLGVVIMSCDLVRLGGGSAAIVVVQISVLVMILVSTVALAVTTDTGPSARGLQACNTAYTRTMMLSRTMAMLRRSSTNDGVGGTTKAGVGSAGLS